MKVTITQEDGSSEDFFPQSYTDGAVAAAVAAAPTLAPVVEPEDTEVDILLSDGTTKKFVPAV